MMDEYTDVLDKLRNDNINHPNHYANKNIEVIDYIKDTITPEQYEGYLVGNIIKYISRYQKKNGVEDIKKAQIYIGWLIKHLEDSNNGKT